MDHTIRDYLLPTISLPLSVSRPILRPLETSAAAMPFTTSAPRQRYPTSRHELSIINTYQNTRSKCPERHRSLFPSCFARSPVATSPPLCLHQPGHSLLTSRYRFVNLVGRYGNLGFDRVTRQSHSAHIGILTPTDSYRLGWAGP